MKFFHSFKAIALAAATWGVLAAAPAHAEWLEARTRHFVITGDTSESAIRKRAVRLEQFDAALRYLLGTKDEGLKVHLFLLKSMSDVQRLAGSNSVGGFYSASPEMARAFMPMSLGFQADGFGPEKILFHEYTHHMLLGSTTAYIPRWTTEGLAELFMTAMINDDGSVTIGAGNIARMSSLAAMRRWSVEEMLRKDDQKVSDAESIERYSMGWALSHYLWLSGKRSGEYVKFIELLNKTGNQVESGRAAFGDLAKLNREVGAYFRNSAFNVSRLSAEQIKAPTDVAIRKMRAGEAEMMEFRMRSARGVDKAEAEELFGRTLPIARRYPDDATVQVWFTEIALDAQRFDEANLAADRALAVEPKNLFALAFKGRIAAKTALDSKKMEDWKAARAWFRRANRVDINDPYPFILYYDSFAAAGEKPSEDAVAGLFRAVLLMPQELEIRQRAALELIRYNELAKARLILAPSALAAHKSADNPIAQLLAAMDEGKSADELIAKAEALKLLSINSLIPPKEGGAPKDNAGDSN